MRYALKFCHTMGAIGFMGSMAAFLVLLGVAPSPSASLSGYAAIRGAMGAIAVWIFLPSLGLTLVAGLLAMGMTNVYLHAGWAYVKLATGILVFEFGFAGIQGPMQEEAAQSARALAGEVDPATLATTLSAERTTLWIMMAIATLNVVFGIWRPRLSRRPDAPARPKSAAAAPAAER